MIKCQELWFNAKSSGQHFYMKCNKCKNYYITWDKNLPHGCRAMKFKSKEIPAVVVFKSSGFHCQLFKEKKIIK